MSLDWIWVMPNKASARKAIRVGVFVCALLALVDFAIASLLSTSSWREYGSSLRGVFLELAVVYVIVGWRVQRNSRIWAVLGLLVTLYFYRDKFTHVPGALLPLLVTLALVNTVRATFLFHKYEMEKQAPSPEIPMR